MLLVQTYFAKKLVLNHSTKLMVVQLIQTTLLLVFVVIELATKNRRFLRMICLTIMEKNWKVQINQHEFLLRKVQVHWLSSSLEFLAFSLSEFAFFFLLGSHLLLTLLRLEVELVWFVSKCGK